MAPRLTLAITSLFLLSIIGATTAQAVDPDIAGWWRLDGNAEDSSGHDHHGVPYGDPAWVTGYHAGALSFDGVDDRVEMPTTSPAQGFPATDGEVTWTLWLKTGASSAIQTPITQGPAGAAHIQGNRSINVEVSGVIMVRAHTVGALTSLNSAATVNDDEWHHVTAAIAFDTDGANDTMQVYIDGDLSKGYEVTGVDINQYAGVAGDFIVTLGARGSTPFGGLLDDVRIYSRVLTADELVKVMQGGFETASGPIPADGASDISRDTLLSWSPGQFARTHDIYFGSALDDVNAADRANPSGTLVSQDQDANSYDPDRLEFGQTYYWRVDEVNGAPDYTIFRGDVWSFRTERLAYPIEGVITTTNAVSDAGAGPENIVNGSGLNANDQHSVESGDMWLASPASDQPISITFAFDRIYKLHELLVWNYNVQFELMLGFGIKTALVEYSADGEEWISLGEVELAQASALDTYSANTTIDFDGVAAQYVRITVVNGYSAMGKSGLSEVRFLAIPVHASEPDPAVGTADVSVDTSLSWRAGREAAVHDVYLGTDPNALTLSDSVADSTFDPDALDLSTTYYWRIDEVNEAEAISTWNGPTWDFATEAFLVVEDFESYDDEDNRIYDTWLDGWVNETGSTVGYLEAPFAERDIVHGGTQSMPLFYENAGGLTVSEAELNFEEPQNWSLHGVQSLSLFLHGNAANTYGQLYLKINDTRVPYPDLPDVLGRAQWVPWTVDLSATGADLANVTSLTIGVEGTGASGQVLVDDIRLYPHAAELIEPVLPDGNDPNLAAHYEFEGNAADSRGNYPGTPMGEPGYAAGKVGQAIDLDNDDDYVVYTFAQEEVWSACSVSLWVRTDLLAQDQYSGLFNNNSSSADFQLEMDGNDPGNYRYQGSAVRVLGPASSDWVHLAVSCDGVATRLYYNGLYVATINVADTRFGQIAFGINRGLNNRFGGAIDEVRLYNRALSDAEVLGLADVTAAVSREF